MAQLFANNAQGTLASSVNTSTTTISLTTGAGSLFPSPSGGDFFMLTLTQPGVESSWEIVKVTARSSDSLTVVRAQEGTSAASWAAGSKAELRLTAGARWSLSNIDESIAPTWTGAHQFNQALGIGASNSNSTGSMLVVAGAQFNSLLVRSTGTSGGVGSSDIYLGSATGDSSGGIVGYDHTTNNLSFGAGGAVKLKLTSGGNLLLGGNAPADTVAIRRSLTLTTPDTSGAGLATLSFVGPTANQSNNGYIGWYDSGNTSSTTLRNAYILSGSAGSSPNNSGSFMAFATKSDGVAGTGTIRLRIENTGFVWLVSDSQELQIGAGNDLRLYHNGTDSFIENDTGNLVLKVNGELDLEEVTTGTTAPSAGGAGALPATPAGYMTAVINGTTRQIAYY